MTKPKLKSFIVRMRSTVIEDYEVEAKSEADAKDRAELGEGTLCNEVERPDMEIVSIHPNE